MHLLKLQHQPERASRSSLLTVKVNSREIEKILKVSPSLRRELPDFKSEAYADAREDASIETGLPIATFPETPTVDFDRALHAALVGEDFGGEAALS
jgi:hypothetical protein